MAVFDFGWNLYLYIFSSFRRTRYIHWWMWPNLNSIGEWQIFCSSALPGHPAAQGNTSSDNRARYFLSFLGQIHSDTKYKLLGGGANKIQWQKCQNCDVLPIDRDGHPYAGFFLPPHFWSHLPETLTVNLSIPRLAPCKSSIWHLTFRITFKGEITWSLICSAIVDPSHLLSQKVLKFTPGDKDSFLKGRRCPVSNPFWLRRMAPEMESPSIEPSFEAEMDFRICKMVPNWPITKCFPKSSTYFPSFTFHTICVWLADACPQIWRLFVESQDVPDLWDGGRHHICLQSHLGPAERSATN